MADMQTTSNAVLERLEAAWTRSDSLFDWLGDSWLERPIPLRHPFVFYLGHLPAFAWNQVVGGVLGREPFDRAKCELFERGIDPLSQQAADAESIHAWPAIDDISTFRDRVRDELREAASEIESDDRDPLRAGSRVYHIVLEHELMHHETLLYMLQELAHDSKTPPARRPRLELGTAPEQEVLEIPGGEVTLGADFDAIPFGWDNEFARHTVQVAPFRIQRYPVTVEAFRDFVDAGGYRRRELWSEDAWAWVESSGLRHPHHWKRADGTWVRRTLFEDVDLADAGGWPVIVSHAEAAAYARWKDARLATEAELHRAAHGTPGGEERPYPWGTARPTPDRGNFGFAHLDPVPVGSRPRGASAFGVDELVGNGWEWTSTDFGPYPGFRPWMRTYPGYSSDFFDARHKVLFGAAWPTDESLLRRSFRNWFQPHYPFAFTKFRCAW